MPPDSSGVSSVLADPVALLKLIATVVGILGALTAMTVAYLTKIRPWLLNKRDRRSLKKRFGAELYPAGVIENSTRHYIEPSCQSFDPAGSEEPRLTYGAKQSLFDAVDDALSHPTQYRYVFLLADSGMGKTSFLLNYYARHIRKRRRKFDLALLPLGIPEVDQRIKRIKNKRDTVLFLDALDEDTLAIVDHVERLRNVLELTRDFAKVLITCRTQFFPKDEEIPKETGIIKIGPKAAGEKAQYSFHKLYLTPFTNEQVHVYLKKRYPFSQRTKRKTAKEMALKIPNLSVRPMLLAHIDDLVCADRQVNYAFELYEEMVEAWLIREEGILPGLKREPLRTFSERLAVDLYVNRQRRGAERIPRSELTQLTTEWHIPLDDWQLSGRSLLNRDADGNYKFAHRSIMEYLFVKRFTEGDESCRNIAWTDQMKGFLVEMFRTFSAKSKKLPFSLAGADLSNLREPLYPLRSNSRKLNDEAVSSLIKKYDFFDLRKNKQGSGIIHFYEVQAKSGLKIVNDRATGLTWQKSGAKERGNLKKAKVYIQKLNTEKYGGYADWRLPTLEEAMSLMEPERKNGKLYIDPTFDIDPAFDKTQGWIWTADKRDASRAWVVLFDYGHCDFTRVAHHSYVVRAVR